MKMKQTGKLLSLLLVLVMVLSALPVNILATGETGNESTNVAEIGSTGYKTLAEAVAAANSAPEAVTLKLLDDVTLDADLGIGNNGEITVNLNGFTIDGAASYQVYVKGDGTVTFTGNGTVKNSKTVKSANDVPLQIFNGSHCVLNGVTLSGDYGVYTYGTLKILNATIDSVNCGIAANGSAVVTIEDATVVSKANCISTQAAAGQSGMIVTINGGSYTSTNSTAWNCGPVYWASHGKLIVNGGTFTDKNGDATGEAAGILQKNGTVIVNGGTFTSKDGIKIVAQSDSTELFTEIKGGTFTGTRSGIYVDGSSPTYIGYLNGNFNVTVSNGANGAPVFNGGTEKAIYTKTGGLGNTPPMIVSGGSFNEAVPKEYCAEGFKPADNGNGTYGVAPEVSYVAEVNGVKYETLAEALTALTANGTLTLLADLTDIGTISLPAGAVIEGGNHTVSGNSCFYANANGATFKNVNFVDIANGKKLTAIYGEGLSGKLTVTGCLFDNCEYEALQITPVANAEIVITGNTFKTDNTDGVYQTRYVHIESRANVDFSATVTQNVMYDQIKGVNGAEQSCGALEVYYFKDASKINVKENYIQYPELNCILKGYGTNVGEMVYPLYEDPNLATLTGTPVAAIKTTYEGTYYMTLQDAIDAAVSGDTVQLLTDITQEDGIIIEKNLTLNLNYKTFTVTNGSNTNNRNIKVIGNANLTVRNGSMVAVSNATNDGGAYGTVRFESSGNLTMSNVTLTNSRKYGLNVKLLNGTASFTKVTINSTYGGGVEVGGASATFTNCNFNQSGDDGYVSSCIATCNGGTATVKSGTYNSENYCLYVYNSGGTINVVNGKFVSGADKSVLRVDTSDSAVSDSVINVTNGNFTGTIATGGSSNSKVNDINISGGTFSNAVAKEYCADGFVPVSTEDGKYTVTESSDVFGTSFYARNLDITMDGHYRVVLFAGIDSLNYEKVGFKITAGDITVTYDSKNVYRSVTISGTQYSAEQFDVFRLFGLAIQFPEVWDNTPIDYQPFAVDLDGNVIYGEIYTIDDIYTK